MSTLLFADVARLPAFQDVVSLSDTVALGQTCNALRYETRSFPQWKELYRSDDLRPVSVLSEPKDKDFRKLCRGYAAYKKATWEGKALTQPEKKDSVAFGEFRCGGPVPPSDIPIYTEGNMSGTPLAVLRRNQNLCIAGIVVGLGLVVGSCFTGIPALIAVAVCVLIAALCFFLYHAGCLQSGQPVASPMTLLPKES